MMLKTSFELKWTALRLLWCIIIDTTANYERCIMNVAQVENERSPARMLNDVSQSGPKIVVKQRLVHQVLGLAPISEFKSDIHLFGSSL